MVSGGSLRAAVLGRVVGLAVGPGAPEDARPGAGEDADGVGMVAASGAGAAVDVGGPGALVAGVVGQAGERGAQALVAGPAPADASGLAALIGDGGDAGLGGELVLGSGSGRARRRARPGSGRRRSVPALGNDMTIRPSGSVGDRRARCGWRAWRSRRPGLAACAPSARTSSPLASPSASPAQSFGGAAQAVEQRLGGAAAAVAVLGEEAGQALGPEAAAASGVG